jgi:isopentenyldiphosphate isomerase/intracellular septation protein A
MNQRLAIIRQLLPGLLPLIIFMVADEIWGTTIGLIVAIAIGIIELTVGFIRGKGFDKFVLLDLGLIITMGGISLWLENDFFFKLKPVIIGAIMCIMLGAAAFLPGNIMLEMSKRYFKDIQIDPWQQLEFKRSMKVFFVLLVVHTLVTLLVVFYGSTRLWGIVSGAGLFVLFGLFLILELIRKRLQLRKFTAEEWLPLVDEEGKILGKAPRSVVHNKSMLLHPVVHLHVFSKGKIYLQKRPLHKLIQPGKWDTAVGGHISFGEPIENALAREAQEEIGITNFTPQLMAKYIWESKVEKELVFSFITDFNKPIKPSTDEVEEGRFWSIEEIDNNLGKEVFTPNFEKEYQMLKQLLKLDN